MNSSNTNNMHESLWFNFMWKKPYKIDIQWHLFINEMQLKFSDLKFSEFPMIPTCVMPSPLVRAGHSNSFLMSSIWERWWDFTSDKFQRNCDFHLAHSHSLWMNEAAMLWAALWRCPCDQELPTDSQKLNTIYNHMNELGSDSPPHKTWNNPGWDLEPEDPAKWSGFLTQRAVR